MSARTPRALNSSRKRRIALGCGQKVEDVNRLLKQFDQMQQLMKQMNGKGKKRKLPGKMGGFPRLPRYVIIGPQPGLTIYFEFYLEVKPHG